jgi:hypothetical protein
LQSLACLQDCDPAWQHYAPNPLYFCGLIVLPVCIAWSCPACRTMILCGSTTPHHPLYCILFACLCCLVLYCLQDYDPVWEHYAYIYPVWVGDFGKNNMSASINMSEVARVSAGAQGATWTVTP